MDKKWTKYDLGADQPVEPLNGLFSPFVHLRAYERPTPGRPAQDQPGSGFFIHPRVIVTAAHVVRLGGDVAGWVEVNCGNAIRWADRVTIQNPFWSAKTEALFDIAFLRLPAEACTLGQTCVLLREPLDAAKANIDGFFEGVRKVVDVELQKLGRTFEYVIQNLPGMSGAPLIVDQRDGRHVVAGLHRSHDHASQLGQALALFIKDLATPFELLELDPPEDSP